MKRIVTVFAICLLSAPALAKDVITEGSGGGVNWTQGFIWADGYGVARDDAPERKHRLLARRAAQVDAYRNLAEFVNGVRVNSETVVREMVLDSDVVRTSIEAVVKGAVMVKDHYQNDIAQVTMRIYIDGKFSSTLNKAAIEKSAGAYSLLNAYPLQLLERAVSVLPFLGLSNAYAAEGGSLIQSSSDLEFANRLLQRANEHEPGTVLLQLERDADIYSASSNYSGLLIDARGVAEFELATIPRIRDPEGNVIYPTDELFAGALAAKRPVSYDFSVDDAIRNARIAVTPYVITAQSVFRSRNSDLVISEHDAAFVRDNARFKDIVNNAGVMIVVAE
jgi:hypothetical protein